MKVFLWEEKQFFEVNRKEELDNNTFIISDYEQEKIKESLENDGYIWLENDNVKFSGAKPTEVSVWDDENKLWIIDDVLHQEKIIKEQTEIWNKIKLKRTEIITSGLYISEIDRYIHTNTESLAMYGQIGTSIALGTFTNLNWKAMDNTFFEMTPELFKIIQTKIMDFTQLIYFKAETHKSKMMKLEDPKEYDFSSGWDG